MTRSFCSATCPQHDQTGFSTGVLIVAQRQTALVAKQAACLDVLSGGRFRLGIGVGWNPVEFTGLNENFHNRGRRSEEQAQVMQALWAQPHVTFKGKYHTDRRRRHQSAAASGRVPLWYGGHHEHTLPRIAKWGDGWMPNAYPPDQTALDIFANLRRLTEAGGRDPDAVGIEVWTSCGEGTEADWRKEAAFWKQAGASHICLTTTFNRRTIIASLARHRRSSGGRATLSRRRRRPSVGRNEPCNLGAPSRSPISALAPRQIRDYAQAVEGLGLRLPAGTRPRAGRQPGEVAGKGTDGDERKPLP